jgi:hypothetical protein
MHGILFGCGLFNGQGHDGHNGHHGHKWIRLYGQNGHVQQVTSLNLSIRPSNGKSIVSIPSMMSILVRVHEKCPPAPCTSQPGRLRYFLTLRPCTRSQRTPHFALRTPHPIPLHPIKSFQGKQDAGGNIFVGEFIFPVTALKEAGQGKTVIAWRPALG